jgi:hypothetical protein
MTKLQNYLNLLLCILIGKNRIEFLKLNNENLLTCFFSYFVYYYYFKIFILYEIFFFIILKVNVEHFYSSCLNK